MTRSLSTSPPCARVGLPLSASSIGAAATDSAHGRRTHCWRRRDPFGPGCRTAYRASARRVSALAGFHPIASAVAASTAGQVQAPCWGRLRRAPRQPPALYSFRGVPGVSFLMSLDSIEKGRIVSPQAAPSGALPARGPAPQRSRGHGSSSRPPTQWTETDFGRSSKRPRSLADGEAPASSFGSRR